MQWGQCYFGISLRTGTLIIGHLDAIFGLLSTITLFVLVGIGKIYPDGTIQKWFFHMTRTHEMLIGGSFALVLTIVSISLIYGAYKNNKRFLIPWQIFSWVCFIILVLWIVTGLILYIFLRDGWTFGLLASLLFSDGVLLYYITVVEAYSASITQQSPVKTAPL